MCSPRHVPDAKFHAIGEVPRTLSGKILKEPVKRILMGHAPDQTTSRDSLANPQALDYFVDMAKRQASTEAPIGSGCATGCCSR